MLGEIFSNWKNKKVPVKTIVRTIGVTELSVTQEYFTMKKRDKIC